MPFIGGGDVGSGTWAGDTSSGCGSGLTSGSGSPAGVGSGSREAALSSWACSLRKDFPGRVAVGKSSSTFSGEGTMYASEATTSGVPGSTGSVERFGVSVLSVGWTSPSSSSGIWGWRRRKGASPCNWELWSSSSASLSSLSSTSIGGAETRIGVDGPADSSLTILEFSASLCLAFKCHPSTSPSVSVAESRSVHSPSPSPRELAKLKLLDPSASCLPSCSMAFWTSVIVACITSPSAIRGVKVGPGFGEPTELSGSSCRVFNTVGE